MTFTQQLYFYLLTRLTCLIPQILTLTTFEKLYISINLASYSYIYFINSGLHHTLTRWQKIYLVSLLIHHYSWWVSLNNWSLFINNESRTEIVYLVINLVKYGQNSMFFEGQKSSIYHNPDIGKFTMYKFQSKACYTIILDQLGISVQRKSLKWKWYSYDRTCQIKILSCTTSHILCFSWLTRHTNQKAWN